MLVSKILHPNLLNCVFYFAWGAGELNVTSVAM